MWSSCSAQTGTSNLQAEWLNRWTTVSPSHSKWLIAIGTAPGSVDSLPVRLRPRWKDPRRVHTPYPAGFRRGVIVVARMGETSIAQIARHCFAISESRLARWLKTGDRETAYSVHQRRRGVGSGRD